MHHRSLDEAGNVLMLRIKDKSTRQRIDLVVYRTRTTVEVMNIRKMNRLPGHRSLMLLCTR